MDVGIIARVFVDDSPRRAVDFAVWDRLFLREALSQNRDLDSRIAQSGVILNKGIIARAVAVREFRARLDIASR